MNFHTRSVEEIESLSFGVWMSKLSGPNETQSRFSIFSEDVYKRQVYIFSPVKHIIKDLDA